MTRGQFRIVALMPIAFAVAGRFYAQLPFSPDHAKALELSGRVPGIPWNLSDVESTALVVFLIIVLALYIVSFLGLIMFKRAARPAYVIGQALVLISLPFLGLTIVDGVAEAIGSLEYMFVGATIACSYAGSISREFERKI